MKRRIIALLCIGIVSLIRPGSRPELTHASTPAHAAMKAAHTMLQIVNADRRAAGLSRLTFSPLAARVALAHSKDMAMHDYLSHSGRDGSSPYTRMIHAGVSYNLAGENIGYDTGTSRVAMLRAIEVAMLRSPEHRANLLRPSFKHVGIGVAVFPDGLYVTEDFTG